MHLADAFIQSDLQYIQVIHFYCLYVCSLGIEPTGIMFKHNLKYCSSKQNLNIHLLILLAQKHIQFSLKLIKTVKCKLRI